MNTLLPLFAETAPEALQQAAAGHRTMALIVFACAFLCLICVIVTIVRRQGRTQDATPGSHAIRSPSVGRPTPAAPAAAAHRSGTGNCQLETCPNCRFRVVAKADGRCPSCQLAMAPPRSAF